MLFTFPATFICNHSILGKLLNCLTLKKKKPFMYVLALSFVYKIFPDRKNDLSIKQNHAVEFRISAVLLDCSTGLSRSLKTKEKYHRCTIIKENMPNMNLLQLFYLQWNPLQENAKWGKIHLGRG